MVTKYVRKLTAEERAEREQLVKKGTAAGGKVPRAQALLQADQGPQGPAGTDAPMAEACGCTTRRRAAWRKQAVGAGPLALRRRPPRARPTVPPKRAGEKEARWTVWACSQPPPGHARWSLRLRAERLVALPIVEAIAHATVRRARKKTT